MASYVRGNLDLNLAHAAATLPFTRRRFAEVVSQRMAEEIARLTPIDKDGPHPGQLKASIKAKPVRTSGRGRWQGGAETEVEYAPHVEWGTRSHIVTPRHASVLSWINRQTGDRVYAMWARVPAIPGKHMFARGTEVVRQELPVLAEQVLREWLRQAGLL